MVAINFPMSDIYGGGMGTTEMTVPDADDQNALTDTENKNKAVAKTVGVTSNTKFYLGIALVLILVIVLGGRM
mgnify:CR=1 FL=1